MMYLYSEYLKGKKVHTFKAVNLILLMILKVVKYTVIYTY